MVCETLGMPAVDPAQRRAEIVEATFGLLAEGGVEAATMRRVAAAAGATTGRVTHYFDLRVELLVAALREVDRRRQQRISAHDELDPFERLVLVVDDALQSRLHNEDARRAAMSAWTPGPESSTVTVAPRPAVGATTTRMRLSSEPRSA